MRALVVACLTLAGCTQMPSANAPPPSAAQRAEDERLDRACLQIALTMVRRQELNSVKVVRLPDEARQGYRPARRGIEFRIKAGANEAVVGFPCQETEKGEVGITGIGLGGL
jgi:hypothetical protein